MSARARWWTREDAAGLRRDPFVRAFAALAAVEFALYVTPIIDAHARARLGSYVFLFPALGLMVAGTVAGVRRVPDGEERRFWHRIGAGLACWLLANLVAAVTMHYIERRGVDVLIDSVYLASYLIMLFAVAWRPHLGSGEAALKLDRILRSAGVVVVAGGWFTYLVLVPAVVDPLFYGLVVPSFLGYMALDLMLVGLCVLTALSCGDGRWRRTYLAFAAAATANGALDTLDLLTQNDTLNWLPGSRTDLLWLVPPALFLVAARLRHVALPSPRIAAPSWSAGSAEAAPVRTAGLLLAGAFTFPVGHLWLYAVLSVGDAMRRPHAVLVLVVLVVLGTLATAGYVALARRYRVLEAGRQSLENHLRETQRLETLGRLAGSVAHDFNNLLTAICGYNDLAAESLAHGDPNLPLLDEVRRSAERAQTLTRQLLAFSRRQVLKFERLDLGRSVEKVAPMIARLIGEDIALETRVGDGLGPVMADPGQIESVLLTLAGNARDAMPHGGTLTIVAESVVRPEEGAPGSGRCVQLVVQDTGGGIPPDVLPHIFEPFFSTKERAKGTGLGLASVYGIVTQCGGTVTATSEAGCGASFTILLPQAGDAGPRMAGPAPS